MTKEEKVEKEKIRQDKIKVLEGMIGKVVWTTNRSGAYATIVSIENEDEVKVRIGTENHIVSIWEIRSI